MAIAKKIKIVAYDHTWHDRFYDIAKNLKSQCKDFVYDAYHIGSTAVPEMYARPIIDVLLAVRNFEMFDDSYKKILLRAGYRLFQDQDLVDQKVLFRMVQGGTIKENLYIYRSPEQIERHVGLCEYLKREVEDARHFSRLKQVLIHDDPFDVKKYTEKKAFFLDMLEKKITVPGTGVLG